MLGSAHTAGMDKRTGPAAARGAVEAVPGLLEFAAAAAVVASSGRLEPTETTLPNSPAAEGPVPALEQLAVQPEHKVLERHAVLQPGAAEEEAQTLLLVAENSSTAEANLRACCQYNC